MENLQIAPDLHFMEPRVARADQEFQLERGILEEFAFLDSDNEDYYDSDQENQPPVGYPTYSTFQTRH